MHDPRVERSMSPLPRKRNGRHLEGKKGKASLGVGGPEPLLEGKGPLI